MSETPLISLIIPAYNVASYLPQCLDSALGQTYSNLQIVIVDDGSTDRTPSVIDRYAASDPRIMAIHQKNAGVMLARKRAIEAATGEYFCFLDGDDYLPRDAVEILYRGIELLNTDIICGDLSRIGRDYMIGIPEKWDGTIDGDTFMRYQLTNVMEGYLVAKLYRRGLFEGLQYPADISLAEDKFLNIQIAAKGAKVGHIAKNAYFYVKRQDSVSHRTLPIEYSIRYAAHVERFLREEGCYDRFEKEFVLMQVKFYLMYINHTSSPSIAGHPFTARLYEQLRKPEMQEMMADRFSAGERTVIRLHKSRVTAWMGKVVTTGLRIRQSIAKRTGGKNGVKPKRDQE